MNDTLNYPLTFEPIFKERIWGGRRIETVLGKHLPSDKPIGESWEISDHGTSCSVVSNGHLRGESLRELISQSAEQLLGAAALPRLAQYGPAPFRFPLLVKWIDARKKLSVQVHPPDGHPRLPPGEQGKTECWFVADAEPGAEIYLGLRRGIDRAALLHELHRGTVDRCLNVFPAQPGDFYFVPAGTPHAIGAGVLLAEIQQTSDTTYRLFDWNRVDPSTGRPRELQIEAAIDSIDFSLPQASKVTGQACASYIPGSSTKSDQFPLSSSETQLLGPNDCAYFSLSRRVVAAPRELGVGQASSLPANSLPTLAGSKPAPYTSGALGDSNRFHILVCIAGTGEISGGDETVELKRGVCVLLPAAGSFVCKPRDQFQLLDTWVP